MASKGLQILLPRRIYVTGTLVGRMRNEFDARQDVDARCVERLADRLDLLDEFGGNRLRQIRRDRGEKPVEPDADIGLNGGMVRTQPRREAEALLADARETGLSRCAGLDERRINDRVAADADAREFAADRRLEIEVKDAELVGRQVERDFRDLVERRLEFAAPDLAAPGVGGDDHDVGGAGLADAWHDLDPRLRVVASAHEVLPAVVDHPHHHGRRLVGGGRSFDDLDAINEHAVAVEAHIAALLDVLGFPSERPVVAFPLCPDVIDLGRQPTVPFGIERPDTAACLGSSRRQFQVGGDGVGLPNGHGEAVGTQGCSLDMGARAAVDTLSDEELDGLRLEDVAVVLVFLGPGEIVEEAGPAEFEVGVEEEVRAGDALPAAGERGLVRIGRFLRRLRAAPFEAHVGDFDGAFACGHVEAQEEPVPLARRRHGPHGFVFLPGGGHRVALLDALAPAVLHDMHCQLGGGIGARPEREDEFAVVGQRQRAAADVAGLVVAGEAEDVVAGLVAAVRDKREVADVARAAVPRPVGREVADVATVEGPRGEPVGGAGGGEIERRDRDMAQFDARVRLLAVPVAEADVRVRGLGDAEEQLHRRPVRRGGEPLVGRERGAAVRLAHVDRQLAVRGEAGRPVFGGNPVPARLERALRREDGLAARRRRIDVVRLGETLLGLESGDGGRGRLREQRAGHAGDPRAPMFRRGSALVIHRGIS